jgi:hypothetical protein
MGLRRKWAWSKINWDDRIYLDQVKFEAELVEEMNATELVEILNLRGVRAHRGIDRKDLLSLLLDSLAGKEPAIDHPIDFIRRRLLWFMDTFRDKIRDQLREECDCNCMNKPDSEVLVCYTASQTRIEREMKNHGYKD